MEGGRERVGARVQRAEEGPARLQGVTVISHAAESLCKLLLAVVDGVQRKTASSVLTDALSAMATQTADVIRPRPSSARTHAGEHL